MKREEKEKRKWRGRNERQGVLKGGNLKLFVYEVSQAVSAHPSGKVTLETR
jgi:hypothetical protein